jgi:hypothetical protein
MMSITANSPTSKSGSLRPLWLPPISRLFEAVAIAVASFRDDEVSPPEIDGMTEFTVAVYRNPTEHKIRLGQVQQWARSSTTESPAAITKREQGAAVARKVTQFRSTSLTAATTFLTTDPTPRATMLHPNAVGESGYW